MKKGIIYVSYLICFISLIFFYGFQVEASSLQNNPNVTFSPDGKAFTTNDRVTSYTWYPDGETIYTGVESTMRNLETGEHDYKSTRSGIVPVGYWEVKHPPAQCIHDAYPNGDFHGIAYGRKKCGRLYNSGWFAYCADCGDLIAHVLFYMNKTTAYTLKDLDLNLDYYYLCPDVNCRNLEQGRGLGEHECDAISWNRYYVVYNKNGGNGQVMQRSTHMYNNETIYEGNEITPDTRLRKNTYTQFGYEFDGWNTKQDGSGIWYTDEHTVYNLTTENYDGRGKGEVILYAQWKKSESTLNINPNGGNYSGNTGVTSVTQDYNSTYFADPSKVTPSAGYTVSFEPCGGNSVSSIVQTRTFSEWKQSVPFVGSLEGNTYTYLGSQGKQGTITAQYSYNSITLPSVTRSGYSFGGWYYDASYTNFAGKAGDKITPASNLTLYAQWVGLILYATDNYSANSGKGAADLSWNQNDGNTKVYMLYQSRDKTNWTKVAGAADISNSNNVNQTINYSGASGTYTVPYTGIYTITLYGAQGGGYGSYSGGNGGMVTAKVFLYKGEVLTYNIGGQGSLNGYNGGGSATKYGKGGGCTTLSSDKKTTNFLIAGGGGGATMFQSGGTGGSETSLLTTGLTGGGGEAGGGGSKGGTAGYAAYHAHVAACKHTHTGSASAGGGCYTSPIICTGGINRVTVKVGEIGGYYCGNCGEGPAAHTPGNPGCSNYSAKEWRYPDTHNYICNKCNMNYGESNPGNSCTRVNGYAAACGKDESYVCGKTTTYIETNTRAYGGSNYINTNHTVSYSQQAGARAGNGAITIVSDNIGYQNSLSLSGVIAQDYAAPAPVDLATVAKQALSDVQIKVSWNAPADNGTKYYHKAMSYKAGSLEYISTSNITEDTLTSKVDGYYYIINTSSGTTVTTSATKITAASITINLTADLQYLHVACVDKAGNLSSTTHIPIGRTDPEVAWNIYTEKIGISAQDSVYPSGTADTYYVRCDGGTPFTLAFDSYIQGNASAGYQITNCIFEAQPDSRDSARMDIYTKPEDVITNDVTETKAAKLDKTITGDLVLYDAAYTVTKRSNWCRDLGITQKFILQEDMDGTKIRVTPIAGAETNNGTVYSDKTKDTANSIYLIGDSTPPDIYGLDALRDIDTIDRDNDDCTVVLQASDSGSGIDEFYAVVTNTDNYITETFYSEDGNSLTLNLSEDSALYTGDFTVELHVVDNVGNERIEKHGLSEFTLSATLIRILEPHTPVFRAGESGLLTIVTTGYADRVEVIFPAEMTNLNPDLNTTYVYDPATYINEEELTFMIPLYTPVQDDYKIVVKAYKDGAKLEEYPRFSTVGMTGSVLDSLRKQLH